MASTVSSLSSAAIASAINTDKARLQKPITQLQSQQTADKAIISAWGSIKGSVSSLSSALSGIKDVSTINTLKATSTSTSVVTAKAASSAVAGIYSLSSATLAKTQEIYSAVRSSAGVNIGTGSAGTLNFTLGNGKTETVTVAAGSQTLTGIAAAINAVDGGVQASVIGTSTGARLVLQSSAPGSGNSFGFSGTGGLAALKYSSASAGSFHLAQAAKDATLKINGVPITSTTNTISSAVTGVTFKLASPGSATVTVASSAGSISGAVSAVTTGLNAAIALIASETKYIPPKSSASASASSAKSGPLLGNFTAQNLSTQLLASVSGAAASGLSANAIGLTVGSTGKVSFSSSTFNTAFAANPTGVSALVGKIYSSLNALTTGALGSASGSGKGSNAGFIAAQTTALQNAITGLQNNALQIAKENNAALQILVKQYTAAESASTNAQITATYLSIFTGTGNSSSG
jgi:flagellar hook-associated protein 2